MAQLKCSKSTPAFTSCEVANPNSKYISKTLRTAHGETPWCSHRSHRQHFFSIRRKHRGSSRGGRSGTCLPLTVRSNLLGGVCFSTLSVVGNHCQASRDGFTAGFEKGTDSSRLRFTSPFYTFTLSIQISTVKYLILNIEY